MTCIGIKPRKGQLNASAFNVNTNFFLSESYIYVNFQDPIMLRVNCSNFRNSDKFLLNLRKFQNLHSNYIPTRDGIRHTRMGSSLYYTVYIRKILHIRRWLHANGGSRLQWTVEAGLEMIFWTNKVCCVFHSQGKKEINLIGNVEMWECMREKNSYVHHKISIRFFFKKNF